VDRFGSFSGGIQNSGSIQSSDTGIRVDRFASFSGGIQNSGSIAAGLAGISVTRFGGFSGGISNSSILAANSAPAIGVALGSSFSGGISNTGTITSNFSLGAITVLNVSTFSGGIFNSGTITGAGFGILVFNTALCSCTPLTFQGGITNTGTISGAVGVGVTPGYGGVSIFNSGTITGTSGVAIVFGDPGNTLTLGPGSIINGQVLATGNDTFQLGGSTGSDKFDVSLIGPTAQYQGFSTFNKIDGSTWTLTGANSGTLQWTVQQGTLFVDANMPNSPFTVNGGLLGGNGTIGSLNVTGGIVAPGHSIGTLTVTNNASFAAGTYQVETNLAGQSDKILVGVKTTLTGGTVQAISPGGAYPASITYTILTSNGGVNGAFSSVTDNLPFLIASLSYDANDVFLTLTRNTRFFQNQAGTPNQLAVASALDTFPTDNPLFLAAVNLTGGATRQALDLLSGEIHADAQSVMLEDSRFLRQAVLGRLRQASYSGAGGPMAALSAGGPMAFAPEASAPSSGVVAFAAEQPLEGIVPSGMLAFADPARPYPVKAVPAAVPPQPALTYWAQAVGAWGKINGDGNAADISRNLGGFFTGFDQRFGDWVVGGVGGYTNSSVGVGARASSANIEAASLGVYAGTKYGAWNFRSGAAVTWDSVGTNRFIAFPGFFDTTAAHYTATQGQAFGEISYGVAFGNVAVEPFAGAAFVHLNGKGFAETGGLAALAGSTNREDVAYTSLGARAAVSYVLANGMVLVPRVSAAWQHAFGTVTPSVSLAFQTAGIPFTIFGAPIARDAALVETGADLRISPQATVGVLYSGQIANTAQDHSLKGNFTWRF
jgi:outer membrane autotransporter protein